jgi:predicted ATPase/class 3 adenylate cyclase
VRALPSGSVTLLFTDIEGSTRLLRELGEGYADTLATQRRLIRTAFSDHHGVEVDTQGDAFFIAFASASDAVAAARDAQRALAGTPVRVRMGIHTGTPTVVAEGYVGMDVHRGARICAAGHGGQVLMSRTTRDLLGPETLVRDLGEHRLKDLPTPEWLFQLLARGVETEFPPLRTLNNTNLPAHATSLVGRESELAELTTLLMDDEVRLLTLTGPGGIGKTRLATHLAGRLVEQFRNGVFLVSLAPVSDPDLVLPTVTQTLGVADVAGQTPLERLGGFLRGRSLLLVLDNFEHLLPAAPEIAQLLALESQLKVIVTSRERLSVTGEHERILAPLALDDAVALFAERARAADTGFERAAAHDAVAGICDRVDRLPLAIELAAARVKHVPADELLARLDRRLATLTTAPRDVPERHRTLEATIGWSYDLLTQAEQTLFMRLSVFSGGCTMESAAAFCGASEDSMASLIDKSLLSRRDDRFLMLETVREYAMERLSASDHEESVRRRHTDHFVGLAEAAEPLLNRRDQARWLARLDREHDNFRAVLARAVARGEGETAVRLGGALWKFWLVRGRRVEGRRWLESVLSLPSGGAARAKALFGCAVLSSDQDDRARASQCFAEALPLYRAAGDESGAARCVWGLGVSSTGFDTGLPYVEEALASQRRLGDRDGIARSLMSLGGAAWARGDLPSARSSFESALDEYRQLGDVRSAAQALSGLADVARFGSDFVTARGYYEEALSITRELGDRGGTAAILFLLGLVARNIGDQSAARALQEQSLGVARELGVPALTANPLGQLARLAADDGDYARARSLLTEALTLVDGGFGRAAALSELGDVVRLDGKDDEGARLQRESLKLYWSIGATAMTVRCMERLAFAIVPAGQAALACRLLAFAEMQRAAGGAPRPPIQQPAVDACRDTLRDILGAAGFATAWAEGEAMSLGEAVDHALADPTPARI